MDFAGVEAEYRRLKAQVERGALTEAEFRAQLEELMIEDEQGRWWIVGYETGQWYVHDGEKWVQQEPPRAAPGPPAARPPYPGAAEAMPDAQPRPAAAAPSRRTLGQRLGRDGVSVVLITAGWLVCWGAGGGLYFIPSPGRWPILAIAGGAGGLITGLALRRTDPPTPWRTVPVVIAGWVAGWAIAASIMFRHFYDRNLVIPGVLGGLVGGLITSLALKWAHPSVRWKHVALVTLGWGIGWTVGGALAGDIRITGSWEATFTIAYALWGAIGGAFGSWITFWQLREARQNVP